MPDLDRTTLLKAMTDWLREQVDHASDVRQADERRMNGQRDSVASQSLAIHSAARHIAFTDVWNEWVRLGGLTLSAPSEAPAEAFTLAQFEEFERFISIHVDQLSSGAYRERIKAAAAHLARLVRERHTGKG